MAEWLVDPDDDRISQGAYTAIDYEGLAGKLYSTNKQQLIPFIGAGASLQARIQDAQKDAAQAQLEFDEDKKIAKAARLMAKVFRIKDPEIIGFLEIAFGFACRMRDSATPQPEDSTAAPSSDELALSLATEIRMRYLDKSVSRLADYLRRPVQTLRPVLDTTNGRVRLAAPSLLSVASYYDSAKQRYRLLRVVENRINRVSRQTQTHSLIATAAAHYWRSQVDKNSSGSDRPNYIIITTNYDRLMENALSDAGVPCCVITTSSSCERNIDGEVLKRQLYVKFSENAAATLGKSSDELLKVETALQSREPSGIDAFPSEFKVVVVYKMHGCVEWARDGADSIIISSDDYVYFMREMADVIPLFIKRAMRGKSFLFLGYSFADWDLRSLYLDLVKATGGSHDREGNKQRWDFAVMKSMREERSFLVRHDFSIVLMDLNSFSGKLLEAAPAALPLANG